MNISFSYPWSFQKSRVMESIFSVFYLMSGSKWFPLIPGDQSLHSSCLRLGEKVKLGDFSSERSNTTHSTLPIFVVRLFSRLNKIVKTEMGLAILPTPPLEKALSHKGRDACGIPKSNTYLPWQVTLLHWESRKWAPVCSQGPSIGLCQSGSQKEVGSMDIILYHVFINRVVSLIYPSTCMWLMGQLAGLPGANLG